MVGMISSDEAFAFVIASYSIAALGCLIIALRAWWRFRHAQKQWQLWQNTHSDKSHCEDTKNSV
jgi:hypothetical protein